MNLICGFTSNNFVGYSKVRVGTVYEIGNYVINNENNICLYKILDIILIKYVAVSFIVQQIQLDPYNTHK